MRDRGPYAGGLIELSKLKGNDEKRVVFRQAMTALAQAGTGEGPSLLDGLSPEALAKGVRIALDGGMIDKLDWLAPEAAGAALYELASALPNGPEQRDLGRRVLGALLSADARTFVVIAKRMALGAGKGLGTGVVRARIGLTVELPLAHAVADGALALALVSRQKLARDWVVDPSAGALVDRRMAAKLIERAAREAATRAQQGDAHAVRAFTADAVAGAFGRLLSDRESLVWKHVAVARGLLAPWVESFAKAIEEGASPKLSPTEWRRAATSAAAMVAVTPEEGERAVRACLRLKDKDAGVCAAVLWGLPRAVEAEPDVAGELCLAASESGPAVAEAMADLVAEVGLVPALEKPVAKLRDVLPASGESGLELPEPMRSSRVDWMEAGLRDLPLRVQVAYALDAFATHGPKVAYEAAKEVFESARGVVETLEALGEEESGEGQAGRAAKAGILTALRDIDVGLLERNVLGDLLALGPTADVVETHEKALNALKSRVSAWIVAREGARTPTTDVKLGQRRLVALLHLVDGDARTDGTTQAVYMLLSGFEASLPQGLARANSAALARALEALVRAETIEPVDALLATIHRVVDPAALAVLSEASMDTDLRHAFTRASSWLSAGVGDDDEEPIPPLDALAEWTREIVLDPSSRAEALRTALVHIHKALSQIGAAASLRGLSTTGAPMPDVISDLETSLDQVALLAHGARARLDPERSQASSPTGRSGLSLAISRVLSGAESSVGAHAADLVSGVAATLPVALARVVLAGVAAIDRLPKEPPPGTTTTSVAPQMSLPSWLPPRRTLGGFYVQRPLGAGGQASVFIVNRTEDRRDPAAERFALKVPDYSASAARTLSEAEFMQVFREEASALITLPQFPNIARFVTFDTAARPKPILVMELVEGPNLDQVIASRALTTARWFGVLDDVLAGLEVMHTAGLAHLDVKPSNIVLRGGDVAVLVDFGLAGRKIRPGCASGPYGAPEVWGAASPGVVPDPPKADIYAFACMAFEVLTGTVLFSGSSEIEMVGKHLMHDGFPDKLKKMAGDPALAQLAEVLFSSLRRDPKNRPTASKLRADLRKLAPTLSRAPWPLPT